MKPSRFLPVCLAALSLTLPAAFKAGAQSSVWINPAGGSWAAAANWTNGVVPNGPSTTADFSQLTLPASASVTLDGSWTAGKLIFGDLGGTYGWVLATGSGGSLTLYNGGNPPTIQVNNTAVAISAQLSGGNGLATAGPGTVILSAANNYLGTTTINSGSTLEIGGAGDLGGGAYSGSIVDNGTFVYASLASQTLSGVISGTGGLTVNGPGTVTLSNSGDTYSGQTTVSGGVLVLAASTGGSGNVRNSTIVINPGGELDINANDALGYSVSLPITNSGIIKKINDQAETMFRPIYLNNGSLVTTIAGEGQFETFGGFIVTLPDTTNFISGPGEFGLRTPSCYISNAVDSVLTISTVIYPWGGGGNGPLNKTGPGTLVVTADNIYLGSTIVTNGVLEVDGSIPPTPVVLFSGSTLAGSGTISSPVSIPAGAAIQPGTIAIGTNGVSNLQINNTLSLAGNAIFKISKTGGGTSSDTISGPSSVVTGGKLTVINITSDGTPFAEGDTFILLNSSAFSGSFTSFSLPTLPAGLNWDLSQLSINGSLAVVSGVPTPLFYPPSGGYQGAVPVTIIGDPGATIYYTTDGSTPTTSSPSGPSPLVVVVPDNARTTLNAFARVGGQSSSVASASYATVGTPTWISLSGGSWADAANWSNGIVASGIGAQADFSQLTLPSDQFLTFDTNIAIGEIIFGDKGGNYTWEIDPGSGGPLTLAARTNVPTIVVENTAATIAVPLVGTTGLSNAGSGTLILTGENTYTGGTTIGSGTLEIGDPGQLGNGFYGDAITNNATLVYSSSQAQTFSGVLSGTGSLVLNGTGELELTALNTMTGGTIINSGILFANGPNNINSSLGAGNVTINNGGTVQIGQANSFVGTAPSSTIITVNTGGTVENPGTTCHLGAVVLNGGTLDSVTSSPQYGNWNFDYSVSTPGTGLTSTIQGGNASLTQSGGTVFDIGSNDTVVVTTVLDHPSNSTDKGLIKTGPGVLELEAQNAYTSGTTVNNGTLLVTGSLASGTVTVNGGALSSDGTIHGPTMIESGGTLELITNATSVLNIDSALDLQGDVILNVSKNGGGASSDTIQGLTGVTFGGTLTVSNVTSDGSQFQAGDTFTLFQLASGSYGGGFTSYNLPPLPPGLSWDVTQLAVSGAISVASGVNATPIFAPGSGDYVGPISVKITSAPGWTIYYTTDGSTPTTSSPSGLSPINGVIVPANTNMTITAFAKSGGNSSSYSSATYATVARPTWINPFGGSWAIQGNWSNNVVANGSGVIADFTQISLAGQTYVTFDGVFSVGGLIFGDAGGTTNAWELDSGSGGPLTLSVASNTPAITVSNAEAIVTVQLAGSDGLIKDGPGILDLTTNELYSGGTIVNGGALYLDLPVDSTASTIQGALTVNNGATCWVNQPYALGDNTEIGLTNIYLNTGTLGGPGNCTVYGMSLQLAGGTVNIGGNMWIGAPNILASSAVKVTTFANPVTSELAPVGGLQFRAGFGQTNFLFTIAKGAINGIDLQVDADVSENAGSSSIIKAGTGTLALNGDNSYTGQTVVSNGTVLVNGSISGQNVVVAPGATFGGVGSVSTVITNSGLIAPGSNSVGTLTAFDVVFEPGSSLEFRLSSATNTADQSLLDVTGTIDVEGLSGGTFTVKLVSLSDPVTPGALPDFNPSQSYVWTVAEASSFTTNLLSLGQLVLDTTGFQNAHSGTFSLALNAVSHALQIVYTPSASSPPVLSGRPVYSNGSFTLSFSGTSGQAFTVLATTNLDLPLTLWVPVTNGTFGASPVSYTDVGATNGSRFYSIKSP